MTMYESGISFALEEEMRGAALLWMVSTRTGEPAASSGRRERPKMAFMMTTAIMDGEGDNEDKQEEAIEGG